MFTAIHNWLETHSIRSDVGVARRDRRVTRRLARDLLKEKETGEKIDEGFMSGNREAIFKAFVRYRIVVDAEVKGLRTYVLGYKILLRRALENIELLEQDIKMNAHETHKDDLLKALAKMEQDILQNFKNFLASLTSFENTTYSTAKLLDKASQARDLYYQALQLRKPVATLAKFIKEEQRVERKGQGRDLGVEKKRYELAANMLHSELSLHTKGLNDAFILLQEIGADIGNKLQLIEDEVRKERYPPDWAKENDEEILPVRASIAELVQSEINQSRILLSQIERAQG